MSAGVLAVLQPTIPYPPLHVASSTPMHVQFPNSAAAGGRTLLRRRQLQIAARAVSGTAIRGDCGVLRLSALAQVV